MKRRFEYLNTMNIYLLISVKKRIFAYFQKQSPKVFLEISQNSQENTCARVFFLIKLQASGLQLYLKGDSGTVVFLGILRNF